MSKRSYISDVYIPLLTLWGDALAIELSFIIAYWVRFYSSFYQLFPIQTGIPLIETYINLTFIVIPIWMMFFQSRKMYRPRRVVFVFDEFFVIAKLSTYALIFSLGLIFFFEHIPYSRLIFVLAWIIAIILITFFRYFILKFEKKLYNKRRALKSAIIVGNNINSQNIYDNFTNHLYVGYDIVGYIQEKETVEEDFMQGKRLLGYYDKVDEIIKKYDVEILIVTLPTGEHDRLIELMKKCEGINVEFFLMPDFLEIITSSVRVQEMNGVPFLKLKDIPMNTWNRFTKRIFDIMVSSFILLLASPVLLSLALIIKITSRGPVFYYQERISLAGKKFNMIKFRSMVINAEKDTGVVMASKSDSRYTPIGKFLRRFSLDELPQFINVFKGDMSIVGPRPEREYFVNIMKEKIPKYLERHRVKCGITGWAQVNGLRGQETSMEKRIEYDIYYIENWSIVFDLKIIIKTIREVLFSKVAF